jgi:hypothetical protein
MGGYDMTIRYSAPWHKASFDAFLNDSLPRLLADYIPLAGYITEATERYTCQIKLTLMTAEREAELTYTNLPQPDENGVFQIKGKPLVVVPRATNDDLENTEIFCVGEQLYEYLQKRLGKAPDDLPWYSELARAWLPLDQWINDFFDYHGKDSWATYVQPLDQTNWLARQSHLRRVSIQNRQHLFTPGHFGRACPFETPEGPNISRIIPIAIGAEIRNGKLIIVDEHPEATLGLGAAMIPLLEHNEPTRLLMGTNMLRQWIVSETPEPALIQSGNEPDAPDFWCGRNLLTAFISWGEDTYEDGIVLSESCAKRLSYNQPIEPGDKMSNRHGCKGVVSRILPNEEMPHLADGTPIELIFNFISIHARSNFGQIREAVLSRIARAKGQIMSIPPFHAPDEQQIRTWLAQTGLPKDGMEVLTLGRNGKQLVGRATVGEVYWGRPSHMAQEKLRVTTDDKDGQRLNEYDYYALRDAGAFDNILELFNTNVIQRSASNTLTERIITDNIEQAEAPSPQFGQLMKNLAIAGIQVELKDDRLSFRLQDPAGATLSLAQPIEHPWLRDHTLMRIGVCEEVPLYHALLSANTRMKRTLASGAPESLKQQAQAQLMQRVDAFFRNLLPPIQFNARVQFSGRAVLAPGAGLHLDQVGLAEEIAWELFGPLVIRQLNAEEVRTRSEHATRILDEIMARSWVIIHRAPAFTPQTFIAFHPVRNTDHVIRLHPLVCRLLQADFDGDQVSVFLPLITQAQREAGERLSVAGHLARTPDLLKDLVPNNEALWGLANLSLTAAGRQEIATIPDVNVATSSHSITRTTLVEALQHVLQRDGINRTLEVLETLMQRGFELARMSGASISPFVGSQFSLPAPPEGDDSKGWNLYRQEVSEWLAANTAYTDSDLGPQLLAVKSGAWGEIAQLTGLLSTQGTVKDVQGQQIAIRHGYREGLQPVEIYALAIGARERFAQIQQEWWQIEQEIQKRSVTKSFSVLARAMRTEQPGIVFAHAASIGEIDPLTDRDSRLFVGLPI